MWSTNQLTKKLGIQYPLIQAPMAGGFTTPELVAAVSNAGGLGSFAAALLKPAQIHEAIKSIRSLTSLPFAVNLFAPFLEENNLSSDIEKVKSILDVYREELGLGKLGEIIPVRIPFEEQVAVLLEEKVPIVSFTFGMLPKETMRLLKDRGSLLIGTATTIREAKLLAQSGVDAIVAQGSEAGGHRGSFKDTHIKDAMIGSMALIPQVVDAVNIPVIASGGIMDGRGIVAALALGASAAQMGTAFLTCSETHIHPLHRKALLESTDESTRLTRAFTGRSVRSIKNRFLLELENYSDILPSYTVQSALTRDIRQAAMQQNKIDFMALWSGQAASLCVVKPAGELVEHIVAKVNEIFLGFEKNGTKRTNVS